MSWLVEHISVYVFPAPKLTCNSPPGTCVIGLLRDGNSLKQAGFQTGNIVEKETLSMAPTCFLDVLDRGCAASCELEFAKRRWKANKLPCRCTNIPACRAVFRLVQSILLCPSGQMLLDLSLAGEYESLRISKLDRHQSDQSLTRFPGAGATSPMT